MNHFAADRYALASELRHAAERGQLRLSFQPIVGITSGRMQALEVLLRWQHPSLGMVSPVQFIPLAEASGMVVSIGEWVIRSACVQIRQWRSKGLVVPRLAINLSAIQVHHKTIVERIMAILAETQVPASALEFEITEGSLMNKTDDVVSTLLQLVKLGMRISIDAFGTGYSSPSYLKRLPIHTLKIDQSIVMDIGRDADDAAIVSAVTSTARSLKLNVTAEGVEEVHQLEFLRGLGVDQYQGYFFSKPLAAADVAARLVSLPGGHQMS